MLVRPTAALTDKLVLSCAMYFVRILHMHLRACCVTDVLFAGRLGFAMYSI